MTEFVGTFIFLLVIALSGPIGQFAPLAIGGALMVVVYMGAHISGAHYNPAVSLGVFLSRNIGALDMAAYWMAQLAGAVTAFAFGYLLTGHTVAIHPGANVQVLQALGVEVVFTATLVLVVLNVAVTEATRSNSFYGLAIGFTIMVAISVGGPISGGAFNPAVGLGAILWSAVFSGGGWIDLWLYTVGPLAGAGIGALVYRLQANK